MFYRFSFVGILCGYLIEQAAIKQLTEKIYCKLPSSLWVFVLKTLKLYFSVLFYLGNPRNTRESCNSKQIHVTKVMWKFIYNRLMFSVSLFWSGNQYLVLIFRSLWPMDFNIYLYLWGEIKMLTNYVTFDIFLRSYPIHHCPKNSCV